MNRSYSYEPYVPYSVTSAHPTFLPGMYVRSSYRWFQRELSPRRSWHWIPYISRVGKITCHRLLSWRCTDEQAVASVASTVYKRLLKMLHGRLKTRDARSRDFTLLFKIAAYYAITHSDYFLDRVIALLGRKQGTLAKLLGRFVSKLDDSLWFVYRQVCLQTYWLSFRSARVRDKSRCVNSNGNNAGHYSRVEPRVDREIWRDGFAKAARFLETCREYRAQPYLKRERRSVRCTSEFLAQFWSDSEEDNAGSENMTLTDPDELWEQLVGSE